MNRAFLTASAALLALTLAACSDSGDETAKNEQAAPPAPVAPAPAPAPLPETAPSPQQRVDQAGKDLQDAARQAGDALRLGADALLQQGRETLKDAGPTLDRASEIAGQIGKSVQELAERAQRDFNTAISDLEKRLDETGSRAPLEVGDPAARLSPPGELRADTRAAARAQAADVGPAYVGVWALNAAACGRIDREPVENFAVITPTTIRRPESVCNFSAVDLTEASAKANASCIVEGETEDRQITFSMPSYNSLSIGTSPGMSIAVQFVRCHLP